MNQKYSLEDRIVKHYPVEIKRLESKIENIENDIKLVTENTNTFNEEKFSPMILNGRQYNTKESAGKQILEICKTKDSAKAEDIGEYRGLKIQLGINEFSKNFILYLQGNYSYEVELGSDIHGNITRIDNAISNFSKEVERAKAKLEETQKQFENAKEAVKVPFDKDEELKQKTKELDQINAKLNLDRNENEVIDDGEQEEKDNSKEKESQDYDRDDPR